MSRRPFARTVSEPLRVQQIVDAARLEYEGFEEIWDGLVWYLARKADEIGEDYRGVRIYKTRGVDSDWTVPSILVAYQVKENEVEIVTIIVSGPQKISDL